MDEPLALKHRPRSFSEMIGQDLNATVLTQMVKTGRVPTGLLFSGPSGVGKTTAARILARELNGVEHDQFVIEVDAASNGGVADVRKLISTLRYSTGGAFRVVILDEAHSITREGFNTLLKTLEEPPAGVVFVLVTTEPNKIPETVLSRLMEFSFRPVAPRDIEQHLVRIGSTEGMTNLTTSLVKHLAQESRGNVRSAVMSLDLAARADVWSASDYVALTGSTDDTPSLLEAMVSGDLEMVLTRTSNAADAVGSPAVVLARVISALRDILVLRAGGTLTPPNDSLRDLALRLPNDRVLAALRTLWDARTRLRTLGDPRQDLDLVVILVTQVLMRPGGGEPPVAAPSAPPAPAPALDAMPEPPKDQRATLADLQRLR